MSPCDIAQRETLKAGASVIVVFVRFSLLIGTVRDVNQIQRKIRALPWAGYHYHY